MDYLFWWMTLLLIGNCQILQTKEIQDFLVLFRTPYETTWPPSSYVKKIKEYHRWGNTNGMLLKIGDDYADSSEGMVPLNCAPATASCQWKLSGSWNLVDVNISAEQNFIIDATDEVEESENCDKRLGVYKLICHDENKRPKYSCPSKLEPLHNLCFQINDYRLIRSPVVLDYKGQMAVKLIVLPPINATTVISVATKHYYGQSYGQFYVQVHEIDERKERRNRLHISDSQTRAYQIQSNRVLEVHRNGGATLIDISFKRKHLALAGDFGSLSYDVFPIYNSICVSVIYKSPEKNGGIKFHVQMANGTKYEVQEYTDRRFGEWKSRTFKSFGKLTREKVSIQLDVSGKGTTLHSIFGCTPYGSKDITIKEIAVSTPKVRRHLNNFKDASGKCFNGGVYHSEAKVCVCPEGFTGESCEEGCGSLYFGPNCSSECSNFATGCIGMMFCKKYLSCLCASGFTGDFCEKECDPGFYGPSCTQKCGDCSEEHCDRFTGYCHDGCKSGLRRPFCRTFYKYSKMSPTVTYQDLNMVTFEITTNEVEGMGESRYYQIQYKKNEEILWKELQPQQIEDISVTTNISNFLPGVDYKLRVVYIDKDGNSYQGEEVPSTSFTTLCTVPTSVNYELKATSTSSTIQLYWKYFTNKTDCPITGYTIILQRNWRKVQHNVSKDDQYFVFDTLLPGVTYEVNIKAYTQFGGAPTSSSFSVKTGDDVPLHVSDLRVAEEDSTKLRLSWKPPKFTGGTLNEFVVKYQCSRFLACEEFCGYSSGEISVPANQSYVVLQNLLPHSQYLIEVAASSIIPGPFTSIEAVTQDSAPDAAPEMSETPIVSSTNVTLSVQWLPFEKSKFCVSLNGYFLGYGYALLSANNTVVTSGNTTNTNITFEDLTPQSSYFVHVHIISSGGWNEDKQLTINASTAATVPDKVKNLSIYKRGRRVVGVRWAQPLNTYGEIESFSVSYCQLNDCETAVTERVVPAPCVPWPSLYCHSISNLSPNKKYSVSVRARNVLVNEYGEAVTVNTVTSEGVPDAPSSLHISARTSDSVTLEWGPPDTFNGILRSFLINVEHIDSANSMNCCVYAPLQEVPVKSEDEKYKFEVTDLIPASKYIIAVSAKSISIGPSAFITLNTPPEVPELIQPPTLEENNRVKVPLGKGFPGVNGTYLLLVLLPNGNSTSVIWNSEIEEKLCSLVTTKSFYIVEEYNAEDLKSSLEEDETNSLDVEIGKGVGPRNGTIGELEDPFLPSNFSVGLALVLDYNGALSVGFASAEATIKNNSKPEGNLSK